MIRVFSTRSDLSVIRNTIRNTRISLNGTLAASSSSIVRKYVLIFNDTVSRVSHIALSSRFELHLTNSRRYCKFCVGICKLRDAVGAS